MSSPLESLLASIRRRSKSALWSQGVTLARAGAVAVESRGDEEIVVRVRAPGRVVPPTVVLYPTENEWECDCPSRISPCEHVAAAAIVLGEAKTGPTEATAAPVAALGARVGYRFARAEGSLRLGRVLIAGDGGEMPLEGTLRGRLADPAQAAALQLEEADLRADALLESGARGPLAPGKMDALLQVLAGAPRVAIDGVPCAIADEEIRPQATLTDGAGTEVRLAITADPRVRAVVASGVVLCEEDGRLALHRLAELELGGDRLQHLPSRRTFGAAEFGELVTAVLPDLARRTVLDNRSGRLPPVARDLEPRVVLELNQLDAAAGGGISVLPALVYGAPPCARIDGAKLVHLRGPIPLRDLSAERRAVERLRGELDLLPGRRTNYGPADAPRFVEKLKRWRGGLSGAAAGIVKPAVTLEPRLTLVTDGDVSAGTEAVRFELTFGAPGSAGAGVDAVAVLRAWQEGLGILPLAGGGWASLPTGWLEKHGQRVADLLAARQDDGHLARHALPALAALCDELNHPPPPGLDRLAPLVAGFDRLPAAALPADLTATLRPYQRQGVDWLAFLRGAGLGGVLADDMGLGKTLQAMSVFDGRTLVVAPTSVLFNWQAEIARFRPRSRSASITARPRARSRRRRHAHDLRHPAPRREQARRRDLADGRPRRGAGDQEPGQPDGARRLRAAGVAPPGADRHARREPARRALEPDALREPRPARRARRLRRALRAPDRRRAAGRCSGAAAARAPVPAAPPQAGRRPRAAAAHRRRAEGLARRRRARRLRRRPRRHAEGRARVARDGRRRDEGARGAAAPAAGRLSPGARPGPNGGHVVEDRSACSRPSRPPSPRTTRRWSSRSGPASSI